MIEKNQGISMEKNRHTGIENNENTQGFSANKQYDVFQDLEKSEIRKDISSIEGWSFLDLEALAPTSIDFMGDDNNDGLFTYDEINEDGTITARIGLPSDVSIGDILNINGVDINITDTHVLNESVLFDVNPNEEIVTTITDQNGNLSDTFTVMSPTVSSEDMENITQQMNAYVTNDEMVMQDTEQLRNNETLLAVMPNDVVIKQI
jgi:hypothetical protein